MRDDIEDLKLLSEEELKQRIAHQKWENYKNAARLCISSFNFPIGKIEELNALQNILGMKK